MSGRLADKVALITGAGGGQGRAAAVMFAREGAKVVVTDIKVEGGHETVELVKAAGGEAVFQETDVSKAADIQAAVGRTVETYGGLHILYNNAAVLHKQDTTVTNLEEDMWDFVIGVNLKSVYLGCKYGIPEITKADGGSIINVSSLAGILGVGNVHAYTAAKGGVVSLTRAIATAYASKNIRCNAICPGAVDTPMMAHVLHSSNPKRLERVAKSHPLGRVGTPEDVAAMGLFLASDESSWVTGSVFTVDGGYAAQ